MCALVRLIACLLLFCPPGAHGQIKVMSPKWLVSEFHESLGVIQGSTAVFGAPYYDERLMGRLFWGESLHGVSHCRKDDYYLPPELVSQDRTQARLINIVLVRRGVCSFTTKVRVAMEKGAHAVVIVDHEESKLKAKDIRNVVVSDDGQGDSITIPSLLVSKEDGRKLINAASKERVLVELAWDVPLDNVVRLDLWMSSASQTSQKFLREFARYRKILGDTLVFVPHFYVFSLTPSASTVPDLCSDNTSHYCAEDPDASGPLNGNDVLLEDVRQLCIHDLVASSGAGNFSEKFWEYVERLPKTCPIDGPARGSRFGTVCSERLQKNLHIDVDAIRQCVFSTQQKKMEAQRVNVAWSPWAVRINGWRYVGVIDPDLVTRAICSAYVKRPASCTAVLSRRRGVLANETAMKEEVRSAASIFVADSQAERTISLPVFLGFLGCMGAAVVFVGRRHLQSMYTEGSRRQDIAVEVHQQLENAYERMH